MAMVKLMIENARYIHFFFLSLIWEVNPVNIKMAKTANTKLVRSIRISVHPFSSKSTEEPEERLLPIKKVMHYFWKVVSFCDTVLIVPVNCRAA